MNRETGVFLVTASYCFTAALISLALMEILALGATGSSGPYYPGAGGVVAIGLLTWLWLPANPIRLSRLFLYMVGTGAGLASVLLSGIESVWGRVVAAGMGGGASLLLYVALSRWVTGRPERAGLAFAGVASFAIGVGNAPGAFRDAEASVWALAGLATSAITLLAVVAVDGLGGSPGRLRRSGQILLGAACIFGLSALVL